MCDIHEQFARFVRTLPFKQHSTRQTKQEKRKTPETRSYPYNIISKTSHTLTSLFLRLVGLASFLALCVAPIRLQLHVLAAQLMVAIAQARIAAGAFAHQGDHLAHGALLELALVVLIAARRNVTDPLAAAQLWRSAHTRHARGTQSNCVLCNPERATHFLRFDVRFGCATVGGCVRTAAAVAFDD